MTLTLEQQERLALILADLEPELKRLRSGERSFVEDQVKRHEEYGANVRLSPKQWQWIEDIYRKYVGGDDAVPEREEDED